MGQELLRPPSVKGWEGGRAWLSSAALLARYRFAEELATGSGPGEGLDASVDWAAVEKDPRGVVGRFFPEGLPAEVEADLRAAARGDLRALAAGCMALPEHQLV
jgi:hypothetical protein